MLWEHNSTIVVMLTKLREMGRVSATTQTAHIVNMRRTRQAMTGVRRAAALRRSNINSFQPGSVTVAECNLPYQQSWNASGLKPACRCVSFVNKWSHSRNTHNSNVVRRIYSEELFRFYSLQTPLLFMIVWKSLNFRGVFQNETVAVRNIRTKEYQEVNSGMLGITLIGFVSLNRKISATLTSVFEAVAATVLA